MKHLVIIFALLATPALAADPPKREPTYEELQKQIAVLQARVGVLQNLAGAYRGDSIQLNDAMKACQAAAPNPEKK